MREDRHPVGTRPAAPRPRSRTRGRGLLLAALLALLAACGGGGGAFVPEPEPELLPNGLSGQVHLPDYDLGRIVEQEPNDTTGQAFLMAPVWRRCTVEVAGTLGTSAAHYGAADPVDVLRFTALADQVVTLDVAFTAQDPEGGGANAVGVSVRVAGSGFEIASAAVGASPRVVTFDAGGERSYDVVLTIVSGHAAYVAHFAGADPAGGLPKPRPSARASGSSGATAPENAAEPLPSVAQKLAPAAGEPACADTHFLVRLRDGCDAEAFCRRRGLTLGRRLGTGSYRVAFDAAAGTSRRRRAVSLCGDLTADADVEWAEPDWIVRPLSLPNDAAFNRQWNLRAIGAPAAWQYTKGDPSVIVSVIDSGIVEHPDLAGATVPGYDFISLPGMAGDGDGRDLDPTDMGDQFDGSGLSVWHGTHVAAILGGRQDDGYGTSGMAPLTSIRAIRVLGVGGGLVSDAADAILFCAGLLVTEEGFFLEQPDPIVNLSLGLDVDSPDLRLACQRAANQGVLLVGAVGNTGQDVLFPAAYPTVLAVAAVDGKAQTTAYSNAGTEVDIAAPGGVRSQDQWNDGWEDGVLSAVRDETVYPATASHRAIVGTSQAAPHVAGAAALMLALDPTLTAADVRTILLGTSLDLGLRGPDPAYGAGLLQVHRALTNVLSRLRTPSTAAPELMLPTTSVQFEGLRAWIDVPLMNAGTGTLNVFSTLASTDDGAPWLDAELVPDPDLAPPVNHKFVRITVDRAAVPIDPARYSGTLRLANLAGVLGSIRVVLYVSQRTRLGEVLPVIAIEQDTTIARRKAQALPEQGYRYWFRGIPEADYVLKAGEDLDGDGFICELSDACGWHGGSTEAEAIPVPFVPEDEVVQGLGILLTGP